MIVDVTYCEDFWDRMDEALIDHFEPIAHLLPHGFDDLTENEIEPGDWARLLRITNAKRNWLKARNAVRKRWLVEYWRFVASQSNFERDRQVAVQAMAELMPPSLPPSPPGSEGDAADLSELAGTFDDYCLPDQVLIDELDRVERLVARGKPLWSMLREHVFLRSVVDFWMKLTGLIPYEG